MTRIKLIFSFLFNILPVSVNYLFLKALRNKPLNKNKWNYLDRIDFFLWSIIKKWPTKKIKQLNELVLKLRLIDFNSNSCHVLYKKENGRFQNHLPVINQLSEGGGIIYDYGDDILYELNSVSFSLESDFIRKGEAVLCDKLNRKDSAILILEDFDFLRLDNNEVLLKSKKNKIHLKRVFHLTGVLSNFWSHFLISFFPRLQYLNQFTQNEELYIIIPYNVDVNILELIKFAIIPYSNIRLLEVDHDTEISCDTLFYVRLSSYILCHSNHVGPHGIQISPTTSDFLVNIFDRFLTNYASKSSNERKIFIKRTGQRNVENYAEVLSFFLHLGYEEVEPHKLSLKEKAEMFANATSIVGPFSSGFTNLLFCKEGTEIISFANYSRSFDTYISTLARIKKCHYIVIIGKDVDNSINSNYTVSLQELKGLFKKNTNELLIGN